MALPNLFHALSTATGLMLDQNFSAVGDFLPIACSTVGATNTLVLTPLVNAPIRTAYLNYQQFTGIANGANTTAVNASAAGLAVLPVYKDSPTGPVALTGNEFRAGNAFTLMYDLALNAGGGGFHLQATQAGAGSYLPLAGGTLTGPLGGTSGVFSGLFSAASVTAPLGQFATVGSVSRIDWSAGTGSITNMISALGTIGIISIPAQGAADSTITAPGCSINDIVNLGIVGAAIPSPGVATAWVQGAGSVVVRISNPGAASIVTLSAAYRLSIIRSS